MARPRQTGRRKALALLKAWVLFISEDQRLAALGCVDVTEKPFSADPTGKTDSTKAIQAAVTQSS